MTIAPLLDEDDLVRWGRRIGQEVVSPVFFAFTGPLGAGKSVLARAVAQGAGVVGALPSPTFNLLYRYPAAEGREVVHVDLYRLERLDELRELGWEDLGKAGEVVIVEWAEKAGALLPADRWEIELLAAPGRPDQREVLVRSVGAPPDIPPLPAENTA